MKKSADAIYFQRYLLNLYAEIEPKSWLNFSKRCYLNYLSLVNSRKIY